MRYFAIINAKLIVFDPLVKFDPFIVLSLFEHFKVLFLCRRKCCSPQFLNILKNNVMSYVIFDICRHFWPKKTSFWRFLTTITEFK